MKGGASKYSSLARQIVVVSLISLALGEVSLRIFNFFRPSYFFYDESYNKRFRGTPHASDGNFRLNSLGFKDKEFTPKAQNGYRIVALGDSFAFGVVHYEHNYLTLIEESLQKNHPHVDLLNMGIVGTGPVDYWQLLRDEALSFKPDMVLLSFFIGNDFIGSHRRRLYEYSYLATLLYRTGRIVRSYREPLPTRNDIRYCDDCPTMTETRYLNIEAGRSKKFIRGDKRSARSVDIAFAYLEKIHELCKARGIKLVVVLIPDELQINQDLQRSVREKFHQRVDPSDWDITLPNRAMAGRLSRSAIDYIDLYDSFIVASAKMALYKPRNTHWNIAGNQLAARVITPHIEKLLK
jgi:hypothetical protein